MEPNTDDRIDAALARIFGHASHGGNQSVTVKFEGRGLGIAGACAIACVCAVLFLGGIVAYLGYKVENQQMQLNAVYMMAPHLKPETTK